MKFVSAQNSFNSGELSPKLIGRQDLKEYAQGALKIQNFNIYRSGGLSKRVGTRFYKDITLAGYTPFGLLPFIFSRNEVRLITLAVSTDFKELVIYSYPFDGSNVNATVFIETWAKYTNIDISGFRFVQSGDIIFVVHTSGKIAPFLISRGSNGRVTASQTFMQSNWFGTLKECLSVPYRDSNIEEIYLSSSITTGYGNTGTLTAYSAVGGGTAVTPFFDPLHVGAYFKCSNGTNTGVCKVTSLNAVDVTISDAQITTATDVIRTDYLVLTAHGLVTGDEVIFTTLTGTIPTSTPQIASGTHYYVILVGANEIKLASTLANAIAGTAIDFTAASSGTFSITVYKTTVVNMKAIVAFSDTTPRIDWEESAWSDYQGWPTSIGIFQQRLVIGGSKLSPDTVYNSLVGNYFLLMQNKLDQDSATDVSGLNYYGALAEGDAFSYTLNSAEVNEIKWFVADSNLQIGTTGAEWVVKTVEGLYGPTKKLVLPQGSEGGESVAAKVGKSAVFVSSDGKRLLQSYYDDNAGSYISKDLTTLSDQIRLRNADTTGSFSGITFIQAVYQRSRGVLWLLTSNYKVIAVTIEPSSDVIAWSHVVIGGTDVEVTGITVLPNTSGNFDEVWLAVKRTVDSSTVTYLEKMGADFEHTLLDNASTDSNDYPWYSDSSVRVVNSPASATVAGLSHLEGELVDVFADGDYAGQFTVASGEIELDAAATNVIVGLNYVSLLQTMPIEAGSNMGNSQISLARIDKILFKLFKSLYGQQGNSESNLYDIEYGDITSGETYTGNVEAEFDGTPDEERYIVVKHDKPTPFSLLSIIMRGYTKD